MRCQLRDKRQTEEHAMCPPLPQSVSGGKLRALALSCRIQNGGIGVSRVPFDREQDVFEVCVEGLPFKNARSDKYELRFVRASFQFIFFRRHGWRIARGEL